MIEQKRYTAQEMREYADAIADDLNGNGMASVTYTFDELLPVIQSLRYAADVVERCENELDATSCKDCVMSFNGQHCADYKCCGLHDFHNRFIRIIRGDAGKEEE